MRKRLEDLDDLEIFESKEIAQWYGDFYPEININFCIDFEENTEYLIPCRIREGLRLGLCDILKYSYPLIIISICRKVFIGLKKICITSFNLFF